MARVGVTRTFDDGANVHSGLSRGLPHIVVVWRSRPCEGRLRQTNIVACAAKFRSELSEIRGWSINDHFQICTFIHRVGQCACENGSFMITSTVIPTEDSRQGLNQTRPCPRDILFFTCRETTQTSSQRASFMAGGQG